MIEATSKSRCNRKAQVHYLRLQHGKCSTSSGDRTTYWVGLLHSQSRHSDRSCRLLLFYPWEQAQFASKLKTCHPRGIQACISQPLDRRAHHCSRGSTPAKYRARVSTTCPQSQLQSPYTVREAKERTCRHNHLYTSKSKGSIGTGSLGI